MYSSSPRSLGTAQSPSRSVTFILKPTPLVECSQLPRWAQIWAQRENRPRRADYKRTVGKLSNPHKRWLGWCREGESTPHRPFGPADFKSAASANFAIPACDHSSVG